MPKAPPLRASRADSFGLIRAEESRQGGQTPEIGYLLDGPQVQCEVVVASEVEMQCQEVLAARGSERIDDLPLVRVLLPLSREARYPDECCLRILEFVRAENALVRMQVPNPLRDSVNGLRKLRREKNRSPLTQFARQDTRLVEHLESLEVGERVVLVHVTGHSAPNHVELPARLPESGAVLLDHVLERDHMARLDLERAHENRLRGPALLRQCAGCESQQRQHGNDSEFHLAHLLGIKVSEEKRSAPSSRSSSTSGRTRGP